MKEGKMNRLQSTFEEYLKHINRLDHIHLGDENKFRYLKVNDNKALSELINNRLKFAHKLIIIYVSMICILFCFGIFLLFYYLNSPNKIAIIFGGTFLSMLAISDRLRRLWHEKNTLDIIWILVQDLPPEQIATVIEILYWNMFQKSR